MTVKRPDRQNSAANSTDEHEGLAGPKRLRISKGWLPTPDRGASYLYA